MGYPGSAAPQLQARLGGVTEERVVRNPEPVSFIIVAEIDLLLLSVAGTRPAFMTSTA